MTRSCVRAAYPWAASGLVVLSLIGCERGPVFASPDPDEGRHFEAAIGADGGLLSSAAGGAHLSVPPMALDSGVSLTLAVSPRVEGTLSSVYDFGPDGVAFAIPAELSLAFDGKARPGSRAVLATQAEDGWRPLARSRLIDLRVRGDVAHFSRFAVVEVDGIRCTLSGSLDSGGGPDPTDGGTTGGDVCGLPELNCEDGVERDFDCTAATCRCVENDLTVREAPNDELCTGPIDDAQTLIELADATCGWDAVLEEGEGGPDGGGGSGGSPLPEGG